MEENRMNLESNHEKVKLAEDVITQNINKVMRDNPDLKDKEEIKVMVEMQILMPLTDENISEKIQEQIQFIMKVYDKVFDIEYEKCVDKKETLEEKAKAFNALIRETMSKIPKEYLEEMRKEKESEKQIKYTPLRGGKTVENNQDSKDIGER